MPVACWVLQGRRPGPVLYVHSTQHGNEISGVEVVRRVAQALDPRRLRGTLVAVPIANPLAFRWRRHHYLQGPEEAYQARPELDLGQAWPGDPAGSAPERLAHALWDGAARHATHVIDLHTWNRWQAAATTVDAWHAPSLDLALAFGLWVQARRSPAPPEEGAEPLPPPGGHRAGRRPAPPTSPGSGTSTSRRCAAGWPASGGSCATSGCGRRAHRAPPAPTGGRRLRHG